MNMDWSIFLLIFFSFFNTTNCMKPLEQWENGTVDDSYKFANSEYDALIIGAGYSGIGAATALRQSGINNFLVLEAKDYIGGRVKEDEFHGFTLPMGAGWLHKINTNPINYRLAVKYNLKRAPDVYKFDHVSFRHGIFGYRFNKWYVENNERVMWKGLSSCLKYADEMIRAGDKLLMSFRDCLQLGGWDIHWFKNEKIREAIDYYMYDFENAGMPEKQSLWQLDYTGEGKDEIVTDKRGYAYPILQEIRPFRNKFRLNNDVTSITRSGDKLYTVRTKGGKVFRAKNVVVTFSSGVLNAGIVHFTPELPKWKTDALKMVPMGHYCKYFFRFPYQFWEDSYYIILANKIRGYYVHWQNLNRPHLFPGSNVLLATLTGEMCKKKHAVPDHVIISEAMEMLRIQKDYKNAPDPIEIKRNSWSTDPHTMGAYSLPKPGIKPDDYKLLESPVQRLWFTGEYANIDNFGYVQGAYDHGFKIGGKLALCIKNGHCPEEK